MPRYFFHVRSVCGTVAEDTEGIELPDFETAKAETERLAAEVSLEEFGSAELGEVEAVEIVDTTGHALAVISFGLPRGYQSGL